MKRMGLMLACLILAGCTGTAILPAKITYTYPLADALACYQPAAMGAVAKQDNGTLRLYLPFFSKGQLRPKTIVFLSKDPEGVLWTSEADSSLKARFLREPLTEDCVGVAGNITDLQPGMLVVEFPQNLDYHDLAGKRIWLSATIGEGELFVVRGVYWKSTADFADRVR